VEMNQLERDFNRKVCPVLPPASRFEDCRPLSLQILINLMPDLTYLQVDIRHRTRKKFCTGVTQILACLFIHIGVAQRLRIDYLNGIVGLVNESPEELE